MGTCSITFDVLLDYYEKRLDPATADQIRSHLESGCESCRKTCAWMLHVLPELEQLSRDLHISSDSLAHTRALFRTRFTEAPLAVCRADLILDSRRNPATAGVRDVAGANVQMLYGTEDYDVDLWQESMEGGLWYLIGQVFPKSDGEAITPQTVVLNSVDGRAFAATPVPGEFHARSIPQGTYQIRVLLSDQEIVLPDVVVGA